MDNSFVSTTVSQQQEQQIKKYLLPQTKLLIKHALLSASKDLQIKKYNTVLQEVNRFTHQIKEDQWSQIMNQSKSQEQILEHEGQKIDLRKKEILLKIDCQIKQKMNEKNRLTKELMEINFEVREKKRKLDEIQLETFNVKKELKERHEKYLKWLKQADERNIKQITDFLEKKSKMEDSIKQKAELEAFTIISEGKIQACKKIAEAKIKAVTIIQEGKIQACKKIAEAEIIIEKRKMQAGKINAKAQMKLDQATAQLQQAKKRENKNQEDERQAILKKKTFILKQLEKISHLRGSLSPLQ